MRDFFLSRLFTDILCSQRQAKQTMETENNVSTMQDKFWEHVGKNFESTIIMAKLGIITAYN